MDATGAAECNSQCIGGVGRFRNCSQIPFRLNGALHLRLAGVAVPGEGLLDAIGRKLLDAQAAPLRCNKDDSACMSHQNRRAGMRVVSIKLLHGAYIRLELLENRLQLSFQLGQPLDQCRSGIEPDDSASNERRPRRTAIDHAITGDLQTWINAKNSHSRQVKWKVAK